MATSLDVSCPNCRKAFKVPAEFVGKLIRCKNCQAAFEVQDPSAPRPAKPVAAKPAKPAQARPAAPAAARPAVPPDPNAPIGFKKEEEEEDPKKPKPYIVAKDDLDVPRCPFCAQELDPPDTKVCLNCGYNLLDRKRVESRTVYEHSSGDYFLHWLPAILSIVAILIFLSCSGFVSIMMRTWMVGSFLDREEKNPITGQEQFYVPPYCFNIWIWVITIWICYKLTRFVIRRLVFNWRPPEVVKQKDV